MKLSLSLFALFIAFGIACSSCGGNSTESGAEEVTEEAKPKELTPEELGGKISDLFKQALVEVTDLTKDNPPADERKSKVDLTIRIGLQNAYSETTYTEYTEAINPYL